jgi:hypothetical protein
MILILLVTVMVLAIAFYQTMQGLYGALIMALVSVVSALLAFNYYELLGGILLDRQPAHAHGGALIAIFVGSLFVLRMGTDSLLKRNVVVSPWIDRIGGGVLGLVVGMIMAGVFTVALQMFPVGTSIWGYRAYDQALRRNQRLYPFCPDEALLAGINLVSAGSMKNPGHGNWASVHDDLLLELFCARNVCEQTRRVDRETVEETFGRVDAPLDSLHYAGAYPLPPGMTHRSIPDPQRFEETAGDERFRRIVLRVEVSDRARNSLDGWWRLPATHFRLACRDAAGRVHSYYPMGYLTGRMAEKINRREYSEPHPATWMFHGPGYSPAGVQERLGVAVHRPQEGGSPLTIDWVFCVPEGQKMDYIVFRRVSVADIPERVNTTYLEQRLPQEKSLHRLEIPE